MLKGYAIDDIRKFYQANVGARRTHLYVVGRFDGGLKKTITQAFESWAAGPEVVREPPKTVAKKQFVLIDRPNAEQSTVRDRITGLRDPHHSRRHSLKRRRRNSRRLLRLANHRQHSRTERLYLFAPKRPGQPLPYEFLGGVRGCDNQIDAPIRSRRFSIEIDRMRKEAPSEQELKGIHNYMSGIFVLRNSSNAGIIGQLAFVDMQGLGEDYLKTYVQKVILGHPPGPPEGRRDLSRPGEDGLGRSR